MTVQGYRIHRWGGPLQWEAFDLAKPLRDEVCVRVEACGVGLTVLNCLRGDLADGASLPRVPGHEIVGRVEQVGADVSTLSVGQRVMTYFYLVCGSCEACVSGQDSRCTQLSGWVGVHRDGGYAPSAVLPARNLIALPDAIPATLATAIPDAIATPLHVCRTRARISPGDRVVVIGAGGGVGVHMVEMATRFGGHVAGLEASELKFDAIRDAGGLPLLPGSFERDVLHPVWGSDSPTVVIDLVGSRQSLAWSLGSLAIGGRLVILTTFREIELPLSPRDIVLRELAVLGSRYASKAEVSECADMVATGAIHPVVSQVVPPEGVESVHRALRAGTLIGRGAIDWTRATT